MLISIIIPVYNVEQYIVRCLNSVANQKYRGELECIIVDDCGSDNSIAIVEQFIKDYRGHIKFKLLHHSYNLGLSAARNTGIYESRGDYIFFLDSDDEITPECILNLVALCIKYNNPNLVIGSAQTIGRKSELFLLGKKNLPDYSDNVNWIKPIMLERFELPMTAWNKLYNREWILINHMHFKEGIVHEDELWSFNLAKCVHSISFCTSITYYYYIRENSIMTSVSAKDKRIASLRVIVIEMLNNLDKVCISNQMRYIISIYRDIVMLSNSNNFILLFKIVTKVFVHPRLIFDFVFHLLRKINS